ncbi:hypothetical protein EDB87DRAFT_1578167 [Lactarius vividus]|nr:hypothetical protein EDB87DRAFT_1578167 [Lactarius vividus]
MYAFSALVRLSNSATIERRYHSPIAIYAAPCQWAITLSNVKRFLTSLTLFTVVKRDARPNTGAGERNPEIPARGHMACLLLDNLPPELPTAGTPEEGICITKYPSGAAPGKHHCRPAIHAVPHGIWRREQPRLREYLAAEYGRVDRVGTWGLGPVQCRPTIVLLAAAPATLHASFYAGALSELGLARSFAPPPIDVFDWLAPHYARHWIGHTDRAAV